MIKINLLQEIKAGAARPGEPGEIKTIDPGQQKKNMAFGAVAGVALLVIGAWYFAINGKLDDLLTQKAEKERELREVQEMIKRVEEFRTRKAQLEKQINLIEELKVKQQGPARLMMRLYDLLPDQVALNKLEETKDGFSIQAESVNDPAISKFYQDLDKSPYFTNIIPGTKVRTKTGISFSLGCTFIIDPVAEAKKAAEGARKPSPLAQPKGAGR